MSYPNGRYPLSMMVHLGGQHYAPPGTAARIAFAQRLMREKYGVVLVVTPGWNVYRPLNIQVDYERIYGWPRAAKAGTSNHGLFVNGREVAAVDWFNWAAVQWGRFVAVMRLAGLSAGTVASEGWHVVDLNDPWSVPGFANTVVVVNPATTAPTVSREDEMAKQYMMTTEAVAGAGFSQGIHRWLVTVGETRTVKRAISSEEEELNLAVGMPAQFGLQPKSKADLFPTVA